MSNLTLYKNDEPRPEVDEVLHDYFQSQMPKAWPAFKTPKTTRVRETPSLWSRYGGRIALAACVTMLIAAYWSLSGDSVGHQANPLERVAPATATKPSSPPKHPDTMNQPLIPNGPNPKAK